MSRRVAACLRMILLPAAGWLVLAGSAAYLEPGVEGPPAPRPPRTLPRPPIPRPEPPTILGRWLEGAEILDPVGKGILEIYPVRTRRTATDHYLTLDEGVLGGLVRVSETVGGGTVNRVRVENLSDRILVLIAGEILVGGKQDRTVEADLLLPPRSGPVPIGVFCVEERRWRESTPRFAPETFFAMPRTRGSIAAGASHSAVWDEVAELQESLSVRSPTGALRAVYDDPEVAAETEAAVRGIVWERGANGMIVYGRGRLMGTDLFGSPALFAEYREKLLRAYAAQAMASGGRRGATGGSRRDAERFLERIRRAGMSPRPTPGVGENYRLWDGVDGEMLLDPRRERRAGIVHAAAYPTRRRPWPHPWPVDPPGPMEPRGR